MAEGHKDMLEALRLCVSAKNAQFCQVEIFYDPKLSI